jgi:hypothetical protein
MFLEFTRERYLKTLLVLFSFVFFYCIARILFQARIPRLNADAIKSAILIYILVYQSFRASGKLQRLCLVAVFALVIECVFLIMTWPLPTPVLIGTFSFTILCLIIDSLRSPSEKRTELILLSFPILHFVYLLLPHFSRETVAHVWYLETIWMCFLIVYLCPAIFRKKKNGSV